MKSRFDVVMNFSGKATAVVWDLGVVKGLLNSVLPLQTNRAIFSGNSSGSFMAAYFSCFGLSPASVQNAIDRFSQLDRTKIPEKAKAKALKLMGGARSETNASYLREFVEQSFIKDGIPCEPNFPLIIASANGEIVENRFVPEGAKGPVIKPHPSQKQVADGTYDVHAVPSNQPTSNIDSANLIGKACTYFVDASLHAVLSQVPRKEIQCDLRLVSTAKDLVYAVLTSVSEPTYYYPVANLDPNLPDVDQGKFYMDAATDPFWLQQTPGATQIVEAVQARPRSLKAAESGRYYVGGFLMSAPGQDLKRALPHLYVLSTGRRALGRATNDLLQAFYLVNANAHYQMNRWWTDLEVQPSAEEEKLMNDYTTPNDELIVRAIAAAEACVRADLTSPNSAKGSCAPAEYRDPDGDTDYDFLVVPPQEHFLNAIDGSRIDGSGRQLPRQMLIGE